MFLQCLQTLLESQRSELESQLIQDRHYTFGKRRSDYDRAKLLPEGCLKIFQIFGELPYGRSSCRVLLDLDNHCVPFCINSVDVDEARGDLLLMVDDLETGFDKTWLGEYRLLHLFLARVKNEIRLFR